MSGPPNKAMEPTSGAPGFVVRKSDGLRLAQTQLCLRCLAGRMLMSGKSSGAPLAPFAQSPILMRLCRLDQA